DPQPVLDHGDRIVPRSRSAVEASVKAARDAALPGEEAVADARQNGEAVSLERAQHETSSPSSTIEALYARTHSSFRNLAALPCPVIARRAQGSASPCRWAR